MTRIRKSRIENISFFVVNSSEAKDPQKKKSFFQKISKLFFSKSKLKVPKSSKELKEYEEKFPIVPVKKKFIYGETKVQNLFD